MASSIKKNSRGAPENRRSRAAKALMGPTRYGPSLPAEARSKSADPKAAFESLLPEATATMRRWLAHLGVPERDRDDVAQDVLLAAFQSLPRYDPTLGSLVAWLNGITCNLASHYRERAQHRYEELTADSGAREADDRPGADEQMMAEETRRIVRALFDTLEPRDRALLTAYDVDERAMTGIASSLGVPASTAYKWLYRARARLEAALVRKERRRRGQALFARFRVILRHRPDIFIFREKRLHDARLDRIRMRLARRLPRYERRPSRAEVAMTLAWKRDPSPVPVPFPTVRSAGRRRTAAETAAFFVSLRPLETCSPSDVQEIVVQGSAPPIPYPQLRRPCRPRVPRKAGAPDPLASGPFTSDWRPSRKERLFAPSIALDPYVEPSSASPSPDVSASGATTARRYAQPAVSILVTSASTSASTRAISPAR